MSIRLRTTYMGRNRCMSKMCIYFVKHPNIIDYLRSFLWFLQKMGVQGYLKHSSVIFPVRKTRIVFSWETRLIDPKATQISAAEGHGAFCGSQSWDSKVRGGGWRFMRWMVDEASHFHCLVEYFFVVEKVLNC